jgi:hypothetical protein
LKEISYTTESTILSGINNEAIFDQMPVDMIEKENAQWTVPPDRTLQDVEQESSSCSSTLAFVSVWK